MGAVRVQADRCAAVTPPAATADRPRGKVGIAMSGEAYHCGTSVSEKTLHGPFLEASREYGDLGMSQRVAMHRMFSGDLHPLQGLPVDADVPL